MFKKLTDAILFVDNFPELVQFLSENHPNLLETTDSGDIRMPPVVTGFSRTPAKTSEDGTSVLVYARLREHEVEQWRGMENVEVLAETPYTGNGTAQTLYNSIFNDSDLDAKYKSVYDYSPYEVTDEEGETTTVTPPKMFGMLAGA